LCIILYLCNKKVMLELHDVILKQRQQAVSLTVDDGKLACITGPEGAGKTTLLRTILGLQPFQSGYISFDGELLTPLSASWFRRFMGYVPSRLVPIEGQDRVADVRRLLFGLSVNHQLKQEKPSEDMRQWSQLTPAEQYLELLDCVAVQQRKLVLVDEPAHELDSLSLENVGNALRRMTASGSSVLVVSRSPQIIELTNNVIHL